MTVAAFGQNAGMDYFGLLPAVNFRIASGRCPAGGGLPQALWYFRDETIALPKPGLPLAGFARDLPVREDLAGWAGAHPPGSALDYPPLVWIGAPAVERAARISPAATTVTTSRGEVALELVARLPLNQSWFDASSAAFFCGSPVKMRGNHADAAFVARTLWPEDFRLPESPPEVELAADPAAVRAWVRAQPQGGARTPFAVERAWRRPGAGGAQPGQALFGMILNGAQGDDDEAHGGHFALITGRVGAAGALDDLLVSTSIPSTPRARKGRSRRRCRSTTTSATSTAARPGTARRTCCWRRSPRRASPPICIRRWPGSTTSSTATSSPTSTAVPTAPGSAS